MDYPGLVRRISAVVAVTLLRKPSFDPAAAWTLFQDKDQWFVRRVISARREGHLAAKLAPDTYGAEAKLSASTADSILSALGRISIPPLPSSEDGIVLDGCRYAVRSEHPGIDLEIEWHCETPADWSELRAWYKDTLEIFQAHLPTPTIPLQVIEPWCE